MQVSYIYKIQYRVYQKLGPKAKQNSEAPEPDKEKTNAVEDSTDDI
jgi:hypothetical protein